MSEEKPYQAPSQPEQSSSLGQNLGSGVFFAGLAVLAYGAVAFWLITSLPPNGGASGRLPSLYVMGAGIAVLVIGMVIKSATAPKGSPESGAATKTIPTSYGLLLILGIIAVAFAYISQL